jgi:hypothetical protein
MTRQFHLSFAHYVGAAAVLVGGVSSPRVDAALSVYVIPDTPASNDTFSLKALHGFGDPGQQRIDQSISITGQQIDISVTILDKHCCGNVFPQVLVSDGAKFNNNIGPLATGTYHVDVQMWRKLLSDGTTSLFDTGSFTFQVGGPRRQPIGDYDQNGIVDASDYTVWRDALGQSSLSHPADGDHSGVVDQGDYNVWTSHFGATGSGSLSDIAVPEPGSWLMMLVGVPILARRFQRSSSR